MSSNSEAGNYEGDIFLSFWLVGKGRFADLGNPRVSFAITDTFGWSIFRLTSIWS